MVFGGALNVFEGPLQLILTPPAPLVAPMQSVF